MNAQEFNQFTKLNVSEEKYKEIEKAYMLFPNLSKSSFCTMWMTMTDIEREETIMAGEMKVRQERKIAKMQKDIEMLARQMVSDYSEFENEETKKAVMRVIGEREFYALLVEMEGDLYKDDRVALAALLRGEVKA